MKPAARSALLALVVALAASCREESPVRVRLHAGPTIAPRPGAADEAEPLRFVFASLFSAERSLLPFERFARYLTARLHQPVEIVRRRTYTEINELLRTGSAQAGIVGTGPYAIGREGFDLRLLAVPLVKGRATYRACLIVRRGSARRTLDDLRGAVFAFADPLSDSGYRYVAAALRARGTTPERFFLRTFFTYSHDNTIEAVRDGIADAGAVHGGIWEQVLRDVPAVGQQLEVIERSEELPINPVVASPLAPPELTERLIRVLLAMDGDPEGQEVLEELGLGAFTLGEETAYNPVVAGWRALGVLPPPRTARARP